MTTNNQCNHAEAIAREMHMYYAAQAHNESNTPIPHWPDLTENEQKGWIAVANTALPIIGKHALKDVKDYLGVKASETSGWKKALYWAASIIVAGLAVLGISSALAGCGHDVTITPDHTEICKDGSCLAVDKNGQSITYRQNAPEPPASAEQAPVVIKQET